MSASRLKVPRRDLAELRNRRFSRFTFTGATPDPVGRPEQASTTERTRRALIFLGLTLVVPGGAQVLAGNRKLGRFALGITVTVWTLALLTVLLAVLNRGLLLQLAGYPSAQLVAVILLVLLAAGWALLWVDTLRLIRLALLAPGMKPVIAFLTIVMMALTSGTLVLGALALNSSRDSLGSIFSSRPPIDPVEGRYNFLILGGDAGEGRTGLRPDSISVASIDARDGSTVLFSIPRNFQNAQFRAGSPLWDEYPNGYSCGDECILNALYVDVVNSPSNLYPGADDPGAEAMMDAASGILDLDVQGYVLLDMDGFAQLIDAMGGVTVTTGGWTTYRGTRPDGQWGNAWWPPGTYTFDGAEALAFARSRHYSSDYSRIRRQQCVQQAMLSQFNLPTLLTRFEGILDAGEQIVETDLPQSQLGTFLDLGAKAQAQPMQRLTIGAPDFGDQGDRFSTYPDFDQIHERVNEMLTADTEDVEAATSGWGSHRHSATASHGINPGPVLHHMINHGTLASAISSAVGTVSQPDEWPEPPAQADGTPITEEYLMWAEDTGQQGLLEDASSTNQYCHAG